MFHCNGWCFTWALAAVGATSVCLPKVDPLRVWELLEREAITHFNGAPTVHTMLVNHPAAHRLARPVTVTTGGAPRSPTPIARMAELSLRLTHVDGLTETYAPFTINVDSPGGADPPEGERARLKARQGVPHVLAGEFRVVDDDLRDVPADGETMGEVVMRGNVVYYREPEATVQAFRGGWFHSGDIAVRHRDGSIELRDRSKDIIISGGENISTIEVEQAMLRHPDILECAVIGIPDTTWGEVPKAFVTLRPGVEFCELPKTSTGKVQKYLLRERDWQGYAKRIN